MATVAATGKAWVIDKMQEEPPGALAVMKWIAWGTGTTAESAGLTALTTEVQARVVSVLSQPAADTDRSVGTITADASRNITECGRFNQLALGGTMLVRSLFTAIPMVSGDRIEFTQDVLAT